MNVEYMRTAKKSYMVVKEADYPFAQYELKMILQNDISCLLSFQMILSDGEAEYWYDVSGMQSLATRFSLEGVNGKQLRFLLENLMQMKSSMEEYLLDDANLSFSADMIYFDRFRERFRFCYIPGLGNSREEGAAGREAAGLRELFENLLRHLDHTDPIAVRMGYEVYERCARNSFAMEDCMECLRIGESIAAKPPDAVVSEKEISWQPKAAEPAAARIDPNDEEDVEFLFEEMSEQKKGHRKKRKKEKEAVRESRIGWGSGKEKHRRNAKEREPEESELLFALRPDPVERPEESSRTEVISEEDLSREWKLVYRGNGVETDLTIPGTPFLVGTDKERANGVLLARTVSRIHAKLYQRDGRLFAEDFNSTNGTYLNHRLLPMNTPVELKEGDRIVFATEEYEVYRRRAYGSVGIGRGSI